MDWSGFYINLDRSEERRTLIEAELAKACLPYERFVATDGPASGLPCEIGALMSHLRVLQQNVGRGRHLHILEDDAVLARRTGAVIEWVMACGFIDKFDILFTDTVLPPELNHYQLAKRLYDNANIVRDLDGVAISARFELIEYYAGFSSYLVKASSIGLVASILADEMERSEPGPVDLAIRDAMAAGKIRTGCLFPFVTSIRPGIAYDTVRTRDAKSDLAMDLIRHSFFVECDHEAASALAEEALGPWRGDHNRLLAEVTGFMMTDAFKPG